MATSRPPSVLAQRRKTLQRDPNSLVASAVRMTTGAVQESSTKITVENWQKIAWDFYDEVGELRFGVNWLANALSRVNLICAIPPSSQGDEPEPVDLSARSDLETAVAYVESIAGGVAGQGQLLAGCARQLTIPGVGYVLASADDQTDSFNAWRVLSNEEVQRPAGSDVVQVASAENDEQWDDTKPNDLLIKVWRGHPRRATRPDSPVRSVLVPLGEISLLSKRIVADARSRLAGNGLLVIPEEAEFPPGQGTVNGVGEDADEFIETFMQVTQVPINDQSSPAATTPLVIRVPGEFVDKVRHVTFYSSFDASIDTLRQAAIRRLALGLDMPPEVLLGLGDSNHWSAWQIAEEAITLHVEPLAETICHALTVHYLRPALAAKRAAEIALSGGSSIDPEAAIVWYDTTDLTARPDKSTQASEAHGRIAISNEAYLQYLGLDATDAPTPDEFKERLVIELARANPQLAPALLEVIGIQITNAVVAEQTAGTPALGEEPTDQRTPPERPSEPPAEDEDALAAALLAAADGMVERALERAGQRLRNAAAKKVPGGATAITCDDPTLLHTTLSATQYESLDRLLSGAWDRADRVAARYGVDADSLVAALNAYARALLSTGMAHDYDRLALALGVTHARRVPAAV